MALDHFNNELKMDDDKREEQVPALEGQGGGGEKSEPSPEELKAEVEKERKARKDQELRAQKAEEEVKKLRTPEKKPEAPAQDGLANKDVIYLAKADIHPDDLDDVIDMARMRKTSVQEAHQFMAPILSQRTEHRRTAQATQTGKAGRGAEKVTDSDILSKAERTGEVPDSAEGMNALWRARQARRFPSARK